ncbi:MAG: hypothetical protein K2I59_02375, partial [Alistipes sp.]|nr:hypothetical protein [Alistipes sp.]
NLLTVTEALELMARVLVLNTRRMNAVRVELFIGWGILLILTSLAEYALLRLTDTPQVLWSWLVPLLGGWLLTARTIRRRTRTGFDDLLLLVWSLPIAVSCCAFVFALSFPESSLHPVGLTQVLLSGAVLVTAEFFRGKGSLQSGSFVCLGLIGCFMLITAFTITFREPFDSASGDWMLYVAVFGLLLFLLPGIILRHIARRPCSKS